MRTTTPLVAVVALIAVLGYLGLQSRVLFKQPNSVVVQARADESVAKLPGPAANRQQLDIILPRAGTETAPAQPLRLAQAAPSPAAQPSSPPVVPQPQDQPDRPAAAAPTAQKPYVDETALRYFARQGDTRRLKAEIARLRSLYPDWVPPDDPLKIPNVGDPQLDNMWTLYSRGQFAAAHAAIAARQTSEPGWTPPKDLLDRLAVAETRERLVNASNAKQYGTVIDLATATPSLLTCADVDVLWRLAEAFIRTDRQSRAEDAYRYVLTTCTDPHDRLATMQKAADLLPRADVDTLLALGRTGPNGDEFHTVRESLARNAIAAGGADTAQNASSDDLKLLDDLAESTHSAADTLLLGGYTLKHGDFARAEHWYRLSYQAKNTAQSAEGLALALIGLKRPAEAEAILAPWYDTDEGTRKAYMAVVANLLAQQPPVPIDADVLARIAPAVVAQRDAAAAQQLGWYSRAFGQDETAARWFATALGWKPDDEPSAYGLAVSNLALKRRDAVRSLVAVWGPRSLRIRALVDPAAARALAAQQANGLQAPGLVPPPVDPAQAYMPPPFAAPPAAPIAPYAYAPDLSAVARSYRAPAADSYRAPAAEPSPRRARAAPLPVGRESSGRGQGGAAAGWRLMGLDRPAEAVSAFRQAMSVGSAKDRQDAAYGLTLAYLRLGLTTQAATASTQAPQSPARVKELSTAILTQRINADYQAGRYADALIGLDTRAQTMPEQTDLLMTRGWSYYHLRRYSEAVQVFRAVAATGRSDAAAALMTVQQAITGHP